MRDEERKAGVRGKARYLYQISLTSLPPLDGGSDGDSLALRSELCPMDDLQNAVTRRSFQIFRLVVVVGHIVIRARPRSFPRTPNSRFELVSLENAGRRPDRMWRESSHGGEILPDTSTE